MVVERPARIDMALDDSIRQNRQDRPRNFRRQPKSNFGTTTPPPYSSGAYNHHHRHREERNNPISRSNDRLVFTIRNDRYSSPNNGNGHNDGGATLLISNLFHQVTKEDLQELFSQVGSVKNVKMYYDRAGRSNGSAQVAFFNRRDALVASDRFHHMPLDGHPMQIDFVPSTLQYSNRNHRRNDNHGINGPWRAGIRKGPSNDRRWPTNNNFAQGSNHHRSSNNNSNVTSPVDTVALDADIDSYMMRQ